MPLPVLLDMDPGVDDALAILLAVASPELEILGLTTVSGNVSLELATANALVVMALAGRQDIPVLSGADRPLRRDPVRATEVHGPTGLGDAAIDGPVGLAHTGAVEYLVEMLRARPGDVTLIATGPLTNLALAEQRAPGILGSARDLIVMGGTVTEPGNVTPAAEFNFFGDPDAASVVLKARPDVKIVGLDVTHRVVLARATVEGTYGKRSDRASAFVLASTRPAIDYGERMIGLSGIHLHDPLAVAVAADPTLVRFETAMARVETEGELTAGMLVADRRPYVDAKHLKGRPVQYGVSVAADRFLKLFNDRLVDLGERLG